MILEEKAKKLMSNPGKTRGEVIKSYVGYIEEKEGVEGRERAERKLEDLGHPIDFKKVDPLGWIKEGQAVLIILVAEDLFNWTKEDIFEMGKAEPKVSFITKMFMNYFVSLEKFLKPAMKYWRKFYDFGFFEVTDINEKEKYFIVKITGYDFDPVMCNYHAGFFLTMSSFIVGHDNVSVEETDCIYKNGDGHEYTIRW